MAKKNLVTQYEKFVKDMKNVSKDTVYQSLTEKSSSNRKVYLTMDEYFEKNKANVNVVKTERKLKKATSSRRKK